MSEKAISSFERNLASLLAKGTLSSFSGSAFSWLDAERVAALKLWERKGLPTRKDEAWKYTSVAPIAASEIVEAVCTPAPAALSTLEDLRERPHFDVNAVAELVFVNGYFVSEWSRLAVPSSASSGQRGQLRVVPLSRAVAVTDPDLAGAMTRARDVFTTNEHKGDETSFAALNTSLFREGAVVYVPKGVKLDGPILLTYITSSSVAPEARASQASLLTTHPRVFALLDEQSEAVVIESHIGPDGECYFSNSVTDVSVGRGARLTYARLQQESAGGFHIGTTRISQGRDSRVESLQVSLGARLSRQDLKIRLNEPGAEAVVDGLYLAHGTQHIDNHTEIEHAVGDTSSEQLYKGILDDESRAVFNGRVWIAPDAQRSKSSQLNNNLLLSPKAEIDTKPELEIYADDVKASHGATIGRLDPDQLFYFESRAIDEDTAVVMLARGFAQEVISRRADESARAFFTEPVMSALSELKVSSSK